MLDRAPVQQRVVCLAQDSGLDSVLARILIFAEPKLPNLSKLSCLHFNAKSLY